jgi:RNA polymerase sigma-70 factor (ECF subfamily)
MRARKLRGAMYQDQISEDSFAWTAFDRAMNEALYRQHAPFVAGFLARLGVAARHIDDEVVRVFAEVHRRAASTPSAASSKAWVAAVALRGAARRYPLARIDLAASGGEDATVREFLQTLEPELRAIFILFELEAEDSESIAAAFGLTVEAVHERLHAGQREVSARYGLLDGPASAPSVEDRRRAPGFRRSRVRVIAIHAARRRVVE